MTNPTEPINLRISFAVLLVHSLSTLQFYGLWLERLRRFHTYTHMPENKSDHWSQYCLICQPTTPPRSQHGRACLSIFCLRSFIWECSELNLGLSTYKAGVLFQRYGVFPPLHMFVNNLGGGCKGNLS